MFFKVQGYELGLVGAVLVRKRVAKDKSSSGNSN